RVGHTDLFAVGTDGAVYSTYIEQADWQPWFRISNMVSTPGATVTAIPPRPGHIDLFVAGLDSGVYSTFHETGLERIGTTSSALNAAPAPEPVRAQGGVRPSGGRPLNPPRPICDLARQARERNSPAAPGLEEKCRTQAKGEAIANKDPLSLLLRNQQPEGPARLGFDIGMAAAEGQTAPGPGKQRIHDSLGQGEQEGFSVAVLFSLERNRNAKFASTGAAIAATDPI